MTIFDIVGESKKEILHLIINKKTAITHQHSDKIHKLNKTIEKSRKKLPKPRRFTETIEWFYKHYKKGKLEFNTEYQRSEVWEPRREKLLIDSILRGYDISSIFLRKVQRGNKYEVLDGQQRLKTIFKFLDDGFETSETTKAKSGWQ